MEELLIELAAAFVNSAAITTLEKIERMLEIKRENGVIEENNYVGWTNDEIEIDDLRGSEGIGSMSATSECETESGTFPECGTLRMWP